MKTVLCPITRQEFLELPLDLRTKILERQAKRIVRGTETIESLLKKLGPCYAIYRSLTDYGVFDWTKHGSPHIDDVYMPGHGRTAIVALKMALRKTKKGLTERRNDAKENQDK